jgi:lipid-binding SYLF domain-containing protein
MLPEYEPHRPAEIFMSFFARTTRILLCLAALVTAAGCATTGGNTPQEKRHAVQTMHDEVLTELYKVKPQARSEIASAPGYAVFSNANVNLLIASFGGGFGVVKERGGKSTYMKMGEVGIGIGAGVKDFRAVFVFRDRATLNKFVDSGWEFGGQADAAAKAGDKGAALAGEAVVNNITVYQLTQSGLALQATVKGTKFWKDDSLN